MWVNFYASLEVSSSPMRRLFQSSSDWSWGWHLVDFSFLKIFLNWVFPERYLELGRYYSRRINCNFLIPVSKLMSERVCKQGNCWDFLVFFGYLSYFLFLYYLYILRSFFNFFQIMDFLNIFSCFEALSSTFGWFSHVFLVSFSQDFLYFGLAVFW